MSTEPISKERLAALIANQDASHSYNADPGNWDRRTLSDDDKEYLALLADTAAALRDYARLREENVEADLPRFTLRDYADAKRFTYLVEQGAPELCMAVLGVPVYTLDRARMLIDSASCLQGPRHE